MKNKKQHIWKSAFILGFAVMLIACGDDSSDTAGFVSGNGLLQGSAFDDSQSSNGLPFALRVRCEVRSGRSKISVDANNAAAGVYKASVISNGVEIFSEAQQTTGDEVEFDFDSESDDIAAGATAIQANFIQGALVDGRLYTASGDLVAGLTKVECEVR